MKREAYDAKLKTLQRDLALLQQAYLRQGRRALIVLEGQDAAGKGGLIRRLSWALDPRSLRVHATTAPNGLEQRQHWMKRFWVNIPDDGQWAVFDRSWYGRVLVERIEGFAAEAEWKRAYGEIVTFEKMLADEGVRIVKLLLHITPETQLERFQARYHNPAKRWKLTAEDIRNRHRWKEYEKAFHDMVEKTGWDGAPWIRIDANDKRKARLTGLKTTLDTLGRDIDTGPPPTDPTVTRFFEGEG